MSWSRVTVFGGSGFLGRQIVRRLAEEGAKVRVAVRHPERVRGGERVEGVRADVWDEATVAPALADAEAVVNTVGHYVERGRASFEAIHGRGAQNVARAAAAAGVKRLVHISGLGAEPASESAYVRARATGERLVQEAFPGATILRPSVIFGPEDGFFNRLASIARIMPVVPLFGSGGTRLQPVFVGDVAQAVARALAMPESAGKIYELGGPRVYTYEELVHLALAHSGRRRLLAPVPFRAWEILAAVPGTPVSRDQVKLMMKDNVASPDAPGLTDLGIEPTPVEKILPTYLRHPATARSGG
jgi:uncharacterized protein YbjT (DUF2867 family)